MVFPPASKLTLNERSPPEIFPSLISIAPCGPDIVPVSVSPDALNSKVVSRVWPSRVGIFPTHLPATSAAAAVITSRIAIAATQKQLWIRIFQLLRSQVGTPWML